MGQANVPDRAVVSAIYSATFRTGWRPGRPPTYPLLSRDIRALAGQANVPERAVVSAIYTAACRTGWHPGRPKRPASSSSKTATEELHSRPLSGYSATKRLQVRFQPAAMRQTHLRNE